MEPKIISPLATLFETTVLPPRQAEFTSHAAATNAEKCDALITFCERALELSKSSFSKETPPSAQFRRSSEVLREMRSTNRDYATTSEDTTPEGVANGLINLASLYLSTELSHQQLVFWLRVTALLSEATKLTMPELSDRLISTYSSVFVGRAPLR